MSLHDAKAHLSVAQNYAEGSFEKELTAGLIHLATGIRERNNKLEERIRSLELQIQTLTKLVKNG